MRREQTLDERQLFTEVNDIALHLRVAEARGLFAPRWFTSILGGVIEANRRGVMGREAALLALGAVRALFEGLDADFREEVFDVPEPPKAERLGGVVPDSLPADFENGKSSD